MVCQNIYIEIFNYETSNFMIEVKYACSYVATKIVLQIIIMVHTYIHALRIECIHIKILNDCSYETSSTSCVHINMQQVFYYSCSPCDTTHANILDVDPIVRCYVCMLLYVSMYILYNWLGTSPASLISYT